MGANDVGVAQASKLLGISMDAVYRLCKAGKLTAAKRRGQWVIDRGAISARLRQKNGRAA